MNNDNNSWIYEFFKSLDQIGVPVTLTYRQEATYKTLGGGVASCLAFCVIFYVMIITVYTDLTMNDYDV